jgi:hypothetical protein|tara:strand:- start:2055 stop:2279 length:225 start_codon:yes stop_codon:yes gene_type:complete
MNTPDSELESYTSKLDNEVKRLKYEVYKITWFMRGGVDAHRLMYETDITDIDILGKIIKENIETAKNSKNPGLI